MALEQGRSLSSTAAELGRDRVGLLRHLRLLGYPTKPQRLDPARRRDDVEESIASMRALSRNEIRERILQLRHRHL